MNQFDGARTQTYFQRFLIKEKALNVGTVAVYYLSSIILSLVNKIFVKIYFVLFGRCSLELRYDRLAICK